jgi:hypothetical protein
MSGSDIGAGRVIAVLLADGWHRTVPGSFSVGPLGFGGAADLGGPGFRFEEADAGNPYQPTVLAGPLDSIIAVRQVIPAVRGTGDAELPRAARGGQRAAHGARLPVRAGRRMAEG